MAGQSLFFAFLTDREAINLAPSRLRENPNAL